MNYAVILAGGHGTRLWPISRKNSPKQAGHFFQNKSLLQIAYKRTCLVFPKNNIFISCGENQLGVLRKQLPGIKKENFIVEPIAKGTAMAIGFSCIKILQRDKNANIVMVNSDHYVEDENNYKKDINSCLKAINQNQKFLLLVGIKPNYPETGYGYIQIGKFFKSYDNNKFFKILKFKEKPNFETAKKYLKSGNFLWNPAWFVFRAQTMISLFEKYLPEHFESLKNIEHNFCSKNFTKILKSEFQKVLNISIDYGIMEKAKHMLVLPSNLVWRDVGTWNAVFDCFAKKGENLIDANVISIDSKDNLIISKDKAKLIALIGLEDMSIIDTKDALFICPHNRSQEVKEIISILKKQDKYKKYL